MYRYKVVQGTNKAIFTLDCNSQDHLLTILGAFFYYYRSKAVLDRPVKVYQNGLPVLPEQVEEEKQKLIMFLRERKIVK